MSQDRARAARYVISRRGELGLTQQQLATLADVDIKTIYNLESGERWPQARTRFKIEKALGWTPGDLDALAAGHEPSQPFSTLAELLEDGRRRRQLTESEAAALAGIGEEEWLQLVSGSATAEPASTSLIVRAARAMHVTPAQLRGVGHGEAAGFLARRLREARDAERREHETEHGSMEVWEQKIRAIKELTTEEREHIVVLIRALRGATSSAREQGEGAHRASKE